MPVAVTELQKILDEYQKNSGLFRVFRESSSIRGARKICNDAVRAGKTELSSQQVCELLYSFIDNKVEKGSASYTAFRQCVFLVFPGFAGKSVCSVEEALKSLLERGIRPSSSGLLFYHIKLEHEQLRGVDELNSDTVQDLKSQIKKLEAGLALEEKLPLRLNSVLSVPKTSINNSDGACSPNLH